jgi:hypothetical protein
MRGGRYARKVELALLAGSLVGALLFGAAAYGSTPVGLSQWDNTVDAFDIVGSGLHVSDLGFGVTDSQSFEDGFYFTATGPGGRWTSPIFYVSPGQTQLVDVAVNAPEPVGPICGYVVEYNVGQHEIACFMVDA